MHTPKRIPATVMGFDFGTQKIGIAVGQRVTGTASPLAPIKARDGIPNWDEVGKRIDEWQPTAFVVGLPINMDGTASELSQRAQKFANRLQGRFNRPSYTMDERLSTFAAKQQWKELAEERDWPARYAQPGMIDSLAAALIVESWYQSLTNRGGS